MVGHYVHAAYAPCVLVDNILADVGLALAYGQQGTVIVVSMPSHNVRDYAVWTTPGSWTGGLVDWTYQGSVYQIWHRAPRRPTRRSMYMLLGSHREVYAFRNYAGYVNMYTRPTHGYPGNRYSLYELLDVVRPIDFWRSATCRYLGRYDMPGW